MNPTSCVSCGSCSSLDVGGKQKSSVNCNAGEAKAEPAQSPESDGSVDSSPLSNLSFDVSEPQWEDASTHFNLQKFPSYEIDWDSL
ncbi:hypothetical protein DEO72_LG6g908 [Vigna unguiculata]|uniref:Uncharacterized protein n=1 Tax=Vigna unguiculata TaxID=3917 RepID=A0A4D6M7W5_VIGUN|nr:hypothetical protein DEO72_LG6g908 [Vigna unguiculata]